MENEYKDKDYEYLLQGLFHHAGEQQKKLDEMMVLMNGSIAKMVSKQSELERAIKLDFEKTINLGGECQKSIALATKNISADFEKKIEAAFTAVSIEPLTRAAALALKPVGGSIKEANEVLKASVKNVTDGALKWLALWCLVMVVAGVSGYKIATYIALAEIQKSYVEFISMRDVIPCMGNSLCIAVDPKVLGRQKDGAVLVKIEKMPTRGSTWQADSNR